MASDYEFNFLTLRWLAVVLACIYVITESVIFGPFRVWLTKDSMFRRTLIYCPACSGFWVGVTFGMLMYWPMDYGTSPWAMAREAFESGCCAMVVGAIWGQWHINNAFFLEAGLRGEDPETFEPRAEADEDSGSTTDSNDDPDDDSDDREDADDNGAA